jgi:hypothetical protein
MSFNCKESFLVVQHEGSNQFIHVNISNNAATKRCEYDQAQFVPFLVEFYMNIMCPAFVVF